MKKLTILICVLAMLLALTGVASASPDEPRKFRTEGYTTSFDLMPTGKKKCTVLLLSQGKVTRHIQGTFTMSELLHFHESCGYLIWQFMETGQMPIPYSNKGSTLTILPKQGGEVQIGFEGDTEGETVWGDFRVTDVDETDFYKDLIGHTGAYEGITDTCEIIDPYTFEFECTGFYVDFTFHTY